MINRIEEIKKKGFAINVESDTDRYSPISNPLDFAKIKVGAKSIGDATLTLGDLTKTNPQLADKEMVLDAINRQQIGKLVEISNYFYRTSGIYNRLCKYMAYMYRYDWLITPYIVTENKAKSTHILDTFNKALMYLDNSNLKKFFGEVALKVIRNGCYYGYKIRRPDRVAIQELPIAYCRSRFTAEDGTPMVEFNMKFFDDSFRDITQRMNMLKLFPQEFSKGYLLYKEGKLPAAFMGDSAGWYLLDVDNTIKFNLNGDDFPPFISVIPAIIDLDSAQELDRKKMEQQLLKIIIQKMPVDKNGDPIFDVDEAKDLHNNAVRMLTKAIGMDVLTTFAEVDVADMSSNSATNATDQSMDRVRSAIYDQAGVSQMQFNTDGNIALEKSVLNDEASLYNLIQQFELYLNSLLAPFNTSPKKVYFRAQILSTTIYNYKDLAKMYKEQTQLGYSKMLPQIALGQSQSSILANAYFENDVLDLVSVFIPPMSSNTMNSDALTGRGGGDKKGTGKPASGKEGAGRPEKPDDEKSTKTMQNKEAAQ